MTAPRVALIVDNPLRDLDGLVRLADELARRGAETYLVPMYAQAFDVPALRPDVLVVNYVRPNNLDLLRSYARDGLRLAVLDTEGAGGKNADEFAALLMRQPIDEVVDLYCLWGSAQFEALHRRRSWPRGFFHVTGCPRFDFCAPPFRGALPPPPIPPGYVLVNTNFPVANPRFSGGSGREKRTMRSIGFSAEHAERFARDGRQSLEHVRETVDRLSRLFPETRFVLRPHPFEGMDAYGALRSRPNVYLRQEGTSLQWIAGAALLLHQNCSTAIEAVMMGVEPVAFEWFNTAALRVPGPQRVSRRAGSFDEMAEWVRSILSGKTLPLSSDDEAARRELVWNLFGPSDGRAGERAAEAILSLADAPKAKRGRAVSLRFRLLRSARRVAGYRGFELLRRAVSTVSREKSRESKRFDLEDVRMILRRLADARGSGLEAAHARSIADGGRRLSGQTILVEAAGA